MSRFFSKHLEDASSKDLLAVRRTQELVHEASLNRVCKAFISGCTELLMSPQFSLGVSHVSSKFSAEEK